MPDVKICDVTLRDGMQVLDRYAVIPLELRIALLEALQRAAPPYLEVGSFVNLTVMPAMAETPDLLRALVPSDNEIAVLVPNGRYYEQMRALDEAAKVDTVALFVSASERYSRINTRMSIAQATAATGDVARRARNDGYGLRAYLSCAFRDLSDSDRPTPIDDVRAQTEALLAMGCQTIALSDTSGTAKPGDVERIIDGLGDNVDLDRIGVHLHDRWGQGITNAYIAYQKGVRIFDASVGGIGGNKAVKNSVGNIATEELVYLFESMAVSTGVDFDALLDAGRIVHDIAKRTDGPLPASKILLNELAGAEPERATPAS